MVLANSGEVEASVQQFETAIRVQPNEPENYLGLAQLLEALGRPGDAAEQRRKAAALGAPQQRGSTQK